MKKTTKILISLFLILLGVFFVVTLVSTNGTTSILNLFRKFDVTGRRVKVYDPSKPTTPEPPPPPPAPVDISLSEQILPEEIVYYTNENLSRPEFCFSGQKAYLAMRHSVPIISTNPDIKENEIVLKVFDVSSDGKWSDTTSAIFGKDLYVLYPTDGPDGSMTDHQLVCDDKGFILAFEAGYKSAGQDMKRTVVYSYDRNWQFLKKEYLFDNSRNLVDYKSDDPGLALLDGTVFVWVVKIDRARLSNGFALYGLNRDTLNFVVQKADGSPLILDNPKNAPFAGVMDRYNDEYRIMTSPFDENGNTNFDQNGLLEYRYNSDWQYLGEREIAHSFGDLAPVYVTGFVRYNDIAIWGFTLDDPATRVSGQEAAFQNNVGEAWLYIEDGLAEQTFIKVSDNDNTPESDDTKHTVMAVTDGKLYIGYKHVVDPLATTIRRYSLPD